MERERGTEGEEERERDYMERERGTEGGRGREREGEGGREGGRERAP